MDPINIMVNRLAREGFWGGNPELIWAAPADKVFEAWEFVNFQSEYEETMGELNR